MTKAPADFVIPSSEIADDGIIKNSFIHFNMRGDKKHMGLKKALKDAIINHGWNPKEYEQEICEKAVELLHDKKYGLAYSEYSANIQKDIDKFQKQLEHEKQKKHLDVKKIQKLESTISIAYEYLLSNNKSRQSVENLKDLHPNDLVCPQQAYVLAKTLHDVGIKTDICIGVGKEANVGMHVFLQTKSGTIVNATDPKEPYLASLNGGMIKRHEIAVVHGDTTGRTTFGGGYIESPKNITGKSTPELLSEIKEPVSKNKKAAIKDYNKTFNDRMDKKEYTIEDMLYMDSTLLQIADKGNKLLGIIPIGGKHDLELSTQELGNLLKNHGISSKDIAAVTGADGKASIKELMQGLRKDLRELDTNHDGKLSLKERHGMNEADQPTASLFYANNNKNKTPPQHSK